MQRKDYSELERTKRSARMEASAKNILLPEKTIKGREANCSSHHPPEPRLYVRCKPSSRSQGRVLYRNDTRIQI